MNPYRFNLNVSGTGCWFVVFTIVALVGFLGLDWLIHSLFILFALLFLVPLLIVLGVRWWLGWNLVQGPCPVCQGEVVGFKQRALSCPHCGAVLKAEKGHFTPCYPDGTIDVAAVEVEGTQLHHGGSK